MAKITFIGAGSTVFARNLLGDILGHEELAGSEIALFDIDAERLATSELVARAGRRGAATCPPKISTTTDRRAALDGADYAINMIQVGGYEPCTVTDFEVPKQFGLRQTIADTLGIGGIMRGLRTIPVLLEMCRDMEELVPRRVVPQLHEPDGDQLPGHYAGVDDPDGRAVPQRAGNRVRAVPRSRHPVSRDRLPGRGHQPHGLLLALLARR